MALKFSRVNCTGLRRHYTLSDSMEKVARLSHMCGSSFYGICTAWHYICVAIVVVNCITRHIVVTINDSTSDIAGKGNTGTRMPSDVTSNLFTWL